MKIVYSLVYYPPIHTYILLLLLLWYCSYSVYYITTLPLLCNIIFASICNIKACLHCAFTLRQPTQASDANFSGDFWPYQPTAAQTPSLHWSTAPYAQLRLRQRATPTASDSNSERLQLQLFVHTAATPASHKWRSDSSQRLNCCSVNTPLHTSYLSTIHSVTILVTNCLYPMSVVGHFTIIHFTLLYL